jgi:hypothetical protein
MRHVTLASMASIRWRRFPDEYLRLGDVRWKMRVKFREYQKRWLTCPRQRERQHAPQEITKLCTSVPQRVDCSRVEPGHVSGVNRCRIDVPDRIGLATQVIQNLDSCAQFTD